MTLTYQGIVLHAANPVVFPVASAWAADGTHLWTVFIVCVDGTS